MVRYLRAVLVIALIAALVPLAGVAAEGVLKDPTNGDPKIQSIDIISFGPQGTLLIGDSKGGQVVAVATKDTKAKPWKADAISNVNEKIAGKLGTTAKDIEILHLAVNPASGTAYIAVRNNTSKTPAIVTVDGDGKIGELALDKVDHVAVPLAKGIQVTDVAWGKDRILVGGLAKEEFGCKVYSIPTPLNPKNKSTGFSTETFHVAHNRWETKAPMTTLMHMERNGKQYVVGSFACTPLVRYPLEDIKEGGKVKGESVVELGNGNRPRNMFVYTKGDKSYLLVNTQRNPKFAAKVPGDSPYWAARVDMDLFDETTNINEKAQWRIAKGDKSGKPITDRVKVAEEFSGVRHMDKLSDKQALVIQETPKDGLTLKALDLP
jgi:hypothetical protein